ncbi:bifunctional 4-hydroxy-2-oxoglutarate aldolase/2-dehydro-3-deoxy-phosphogluconate aldolase [Streptomyces sp. NPDC020917]|uniref:bifunctional 4-hydroxy-2-oxoglutarate aldolase/2-dehydro-3-deoxy-phosphogluconate aldolase n=1 Tax=Streptomyces sp. NPDC020917 TaxID=3365102 RepID=UPI00379D6FF6
MYRHDIIREALAQHVIGIARTVDAASAVATARTMLTAGLRTVEVPLTNREALAAITELVRTHPDAVIGAGTVLDEAAAVAAIQAGAAFLVAPNVEPSVIRVAQRHGAAAIPGCGTATEIVRALEHGADAVKVFPASALSPTWISDIRAALPQAPLVPTGGIAPEDVPAWVAAGAAACGIGSRITNGSPEEIRERVRAVLNRSALHQAGPPKLEEGVRT